MSFYNDCYDLLRNVPRGKVTTYSKIANALGSKAYRAVGTAMKKNPSPLVLPCHRVVKSNGELGSYVFGCAKKKKLLEEEGVRILNGKIVDFEKMLFKF